MSMFLPRNLDEALKTLSLHPESRLLAGGTDTMVEINFNHFSPSSVIALRHVSELATWSSTNGRIHIGAGLPYAKMEQGELALLVPALAQAARTVGSPQIRAAGTIGGNLGTCSPAGDTLPVLSALDAVIHLRSNDQQRDVPFHDFMVGVKRNIRQPHEIITGVTLPVLSGYQGYSKVGVRNAMVISVASACLAHNLTDKSVRIALGAVGPTIIRAREAEAWLASTLDLGSSLVVDDALAQEFGRRVALEATPITDHRSTADYRTHAVGILAQRLLKRAAS